MFSQLRTVRTVHSVIGDRGTACTMPPDRSTYVPTQANLPERPSAHGGSSGPPGLWWLIEHTAWSVTSMTCRAPAGTCPGCATTSRHRQGASRRRGRADQPRRVDGRYRGGWLPCWGWSPSAARDAAAQGVEAARVAATATRVGKIIQTLIDLAGTVARGIGSVFTKPGCRARPGTPPTPRSRGSAPGLGGNLPRSFPTIDKFEIGVATSIKSVDLTAPTYHNAGALTSKLEGYVDKVAGFNGASWDVTSRALEVAIQAGLDELTRDSEPARPLLELLGLPDFASPEQLGAAVVDAFRKAV